MKIHKIHDPKTDKKFNSWKSAKKTFKDFLNPPTSVKVAISKSKNSEGKTVYEWITVPVALVGSGDPITSSKSGKGRKGGSYSYSNGIGRARLKLRMPFNDNNENVPFAAKLRQRDMFLEKNKKRKQKEKIDNYQSQKMNAKPKRVKRS